METKIEDQENSDDIIVRLSKLEEVISNLRNNRNEFNQLTKDALSRRNEINDQINELLGKAKEYMAKRDERNNQVKILKKKRKDLQESLQKDKLILDELVEKEPAVNQGDMRRKRRKMGALNGQIDKLEWQLQTSVLTPEKEKEIIKVLESLSDQINKIAEEVHITSQQTQLWKDISASQKQINNLHIQIIDMAKESQIYHNIMNQNFQDVNALRKNANSHHKKFLDHKKQADSYHRDFLAKVNEKNELRGKFKETQQKMRKQIEKKLRDNLEESTKKAFEKYKNGENLSMEEFRLLVEKGLI